MAKIVIVARESGTTSGRYVDKLIEYLHKADTPHEFVVLTKAHRIQFMKGIAPKFKIIESPYAEFGFGEQVGLLKQVRSLKADLVHFSMVQQPVLLPGKTVTTMHDLTTARFRNPSKNWLVFVIKQQIYRAVNRYIPHKAKRVIAPSKFVKKDIQKFAHVNKKKIVVTYEAADPILLKPEPLFLLQNEQFIMYVGRPMPHKNLKRLIEAFEIIRREYSDLKLVLVGKNDEVYEGIKNFAYEFGTEGIMFTDFVSEGQLRWLYENCRAYIFPSLSEGFGLPGLEAMEHGAPVVSSNATSLPEIYGDAAEYFDPLNINQMADAIITVLSNYKRRKELIDLGKKQIKKYSWPKMAEQTLDVYEKVLDKK